VGASRNFQDAEWDGDPFCPICGNYPCTCNKKQKQYPEDETEDNPTILGEPVPCPICGHLPCTCDGGGVQKQKIIVRLSAQRTFELKTKWSEKFQFGDELISIEEFIQKLFGRLPSFFSGPEDLRKQWEHPDTRHALLNQLEQEGFHEEKLQKMQLVMGREDCDLLDVLEYLAYETTPMEREKRVELVRQDYYKQKTAAQKEFIDFLIVQYLRNSYYEFTSDNLGKFINMKYGSIADAKTNLAMDVSQIRNQYIEFQRQLYSVA
jgi:type I restriction enzyme R subunit